MVSILPTSACETWSLQSLCPPSYTPPHRILTLTLTLTLGLTISSGPGVWSGVVTQKGPSWVCIIPFPHFRFQVALSPSSECHAAWWHPTPVTTSPTEEKKRNRLSTCTAEDTLKWAVSWGVGDHLSLMDGRGNAMLGELRCTLCDSWLPIKTVVLKDHVWAEVFNNLTVHVYVDQVRMHRKLKNACCTPPSFLEKV